MNEKPTRSVIIIGAGIAGLSAGCYARMNGYRTHIFEMHTQPGGLCTSWQRKGYTIDGCVHWVAGTSPDSPMYRLWEEVGAVRGREFLFPEEYFRYETEDGRAVHFFTNLDALEEHWLEFVPEDAGPIRELIAAARQMIGFRQPLDKPPVLYGPMDKIRMLCRMAPYMGVFRRWSAISVAEFASRLKNPALRGLLPRAWYSESNLFFLLLTVVWMHRREAGYPIGGSLAFARSIEKRYRDLGGEITYGARVRRILVRDDRAVGVELEDGSQHYADAVISAADGYTTIFRMLEGRYVGDQVRRFYEMPLSPSPLLIAFGVRQVPGDVPPLIGGLDISLKRPISVSGREARRMRIYPYHFDPTLAPPGKTVIAVTFMTDYHYWRNLRQRPEEYRREKERIADQVQAALEERFPELAGQVEMRDVATPVTYERYTGNREASFNGWLRTPRISGGLRTLQCLPGLRNFYMAGHWTMPGGGLPTALLTARWAVQVMCHHDGREFVTTRNTQYAIRNT